jgi:hypothetical protein
MSTVRYLSDCSQVAIVDFSRPKDLDLSKPPRDGKLVRVPWLWVYWPRRMVARDGQQTGSVTKAFSNVVPLAASFRRFG